MNLTQCDQWRFVDLHPARKGVIYKTEIQFCHVSAIDRFLPRLLGVQL